MNIRLNLSPEFEARLRERAASLGKAPEAFVLDVVQEELATSETPGEREHSPSQSERRIAKLHAWAKRQPHLPYEADDSRESIYEGRGE